MADMQVAVEVDSAGVARVAAERIAGALRSAVASRRAGCLALSGGNTPRATYTLLGGRTDVDWSLVDVFWVDERAVPPDHDRSNYRAAKVTLLDPARVPAGRVHRMPAEQADLARAAAEYAALVASKVPRGASGAPAFDAMVLGMGDDGHTASLFPGEATVHVTDRWVAEVAAASSREARLTLTTPVIQAATAALVIVEGKDKRAPLQRAWAAAGDTRETPIRIVRASHGAVTWIADRAAAEGLSPS
ncbi:MAG: 6-phosphogluconolactonase [Polyangiaceae bacterium]